MRVWSRQGSHSAPPSRCVCVCVCVRPRTLLAVYGGCAACVLTTECVRHAATGMAIIKSANEVDRQELSACGADGAVAKGLESIDFNRQLACLLRARCTGEAEEPPRQSRQQVEDESGLAPASAALVDCELLDSLGSEHAREFVAEAEAELGDLLSKLRTEIGGGSYDAARKIGHSIKGVCANLGARRRIPALCDQLKFDLKTSADDPGGMSSAEVAEEWEAARVAITDEVEQLLRTLRMRY